MWWGETVGQRGEPGWAPANLCQFLQAVDEQRGMIASAHSKLEAQHVALVALGAWRRLARPA
jgi:hypothetical protein